MSKDKNINDIDLNKYEDANGLSIKKMEFGLWLSENRAKLLKILVVLLIAISAFFFIYSTYNFIVYYFNNKQDDANNSKIVVASPRVIASDIISSSPYIFKSTSGYDLVASVKNPNDKFSVHFQYCFIVNETNSICNSGYLMPSEEKYVLALGQKIDSAAPIISFKINNVTWQRIDAHKITDWSAFVNDRMKFILTNVNLKLASDSSADDKQYQDSLEFTITNNSAYGFYEVPLNIAFYRGDELAGVNSYIVENFSAGESRNVNLSWASGLSGITRTEISPSIDLLDDSNYSKYQGAQ